MQSSQAYPVHSLTWHVGRVVHAHMLYNCVALNKPYYQGCMPRYCKQKRFQLQSHGRPLQQRKGLSPVAVHCLSMNRCVKGDRSTDMTKAEVAPGGLMLNVSCWKSSACRAVVADMCALRPRYMSAMSASSSRMSSNNCKPADRRSSYHNCISAGDSIPSRR